MAIGWRSGFFASPACMAFGTDRDGDLRALVGIYDGQAIKFGFLASRTPNYHR